MSERVLYLNGEFVPESRAAISPFDRGVIAGDGIYDVARTFGHRPNKFRAHAERLVRSARYTRIDLGLSGEEVERILLGVFERNRHLLAPDDDYILWIIVTRGIDPPTRNPLHAGRPTVLCYCVPPNYHRFAKFYRIGAHLVTTSTRRTPPECLDPRAKIINKMNHILAEFEARAVDAEAFPLILGMDGTLGESSAANVFFVRDGRVFTPRRNALLGIMRENVLEIAPQANVEIVEGDFAPYDIYLADEAFLTTTSFSILPVGRINGRTMPGGVPGPVTGRLMAAWNRNVGVDVVAQALDHLSAEQRREVP
jgi:branched-chain amino acid aminotransferase